jgi:hypothetical protein
MSYGNLNSTALYAQARREDFLKEARKEQLINLIEKDRSGSISKSRVRVGNLLIRIGERLQGGTAEQAELHGASGSLGIASRS